MSSFMRFEGGGDHLNLSLLVYWLVLITLLPVTQILWLSVTN